jgi:VCBS repeat-containing protein
MAASASKYKVTLGARPQAKDDNFTSQQMTAVLGEGETLDVLANDLGGDAKSLTWVGYADTAMYSQLGSDVAIAANMVSYALTEAAIAKVQESIKGTIVEDTFIYQIQLGNGTYSTATATVYIEAVNHEAEFAGTTTGAVKEDKTLTATGTLTVTDKDGGSDVGFDVVQTNAQVGTYGSFKLEESGTWTYTLNNTDPVVQALTLATPQTELFNVYSIDGTSQQVTVNVAGTDEGPVVIFSDGFINGIDSANWTKYGSVAWGNYGQDDGQGALNGAAHIVAANSGGRITGTSPKTIKNAILNIDSSLDSLASVSGNAASALSTTIDFVRGQQIQFQYKFTDSNLPRSGDTLFNVYANGACVLSLDDSAATRQWTSKTLDTSGLESMDDMQIVFVGISKGKDAGALVDIDNFQILG